MIYIKEEKFTVINFIHNDMCITFLPTVSYL